ncbi:alpha/beta fold hydrolase [Candidatus Acetothermia bacterium]|nr:alpha/beta fold hydrolase [Candidatus Acetothermia bacterium]
MMNAFSIGLAIVMSLVGFFFLAPVKPVNSTAPAPVSSYEEALARIQNIQTQEQARGDLNPVCFTKLLTHGQRAKHVIVFLHGYTSCPEQFRQLGEKFYERGYNVLIPRLPHHGPRDRLSVELEKTTAEEMVTFANEMMDLARGLGERVTVAGLSGGGTMALWLAQYRSDVELAVAMAPFVGVSYIPSPLTTAMTHWLLTAPNSFEWWNPKTREQNPGVSLYSYPRYSTRAAGEILRLGLVVQTQARKAIPSAAHILVITNANDNAINNDEVNKFVNLWKKYGHSPVQTYQFEQTLQLNHDFITPERLKDLKESVYSTLIDLMTKE